MLTVKDIPISIDFDGKDYVVTDKVVNMYGIGITIELAIKDYYQSIYSYKCELESDEGNLGVELQLHLIELRRSFEV